MSYLAIARKYRPATFDEIVGQEHVTRTLKNAIARDRIHHAFLFTGARGVGKTTAARALARALNCAEGPTAEPCGSCTSCSEVSTGTSPDLIEIDGASNNSVDDIRDLRDTVQYAPTGGRYKIYLIDEVHMLSKGAFNALLKTLEEPPPHVAFIFATTEPGRIPDTILSRVQRFDFKRIPAVSVADRLRKIAESEGAVLSDNALRLIARAGEGSMRDAQSLLDQVLSFAGPEVSDADVAETLGLIDSRLVLDMVDGMLSGEPMRCLETIDTVYGYGFELPMFTAELLETVRNLTLVQLSPQAHKFVDLPEEEIAELSAIGDKVPAEGLTRLFNALLDVHDQVSRSPRPRVVLEMAVARLATTRPLHPVGQLVGRLEELERRLRTGGSGGPPQGGGLRRGGRSLRRSSEPRMQLAAGVISPPASERPSLEARASTPVAPSPTARPAPAPPPAPVDVRGPEMPPAPPIRDEDIPVMPSGETDEWGEAPELELSDTERWARFRAAVEETDAAVLAEAEAHHAHQVLELTYGHARDASKAKRALEHPLALKALRTLYGPEVRTHVVWRSGRPEDEKTNLRKRALSDPELQRIMGALGGTLRDVSPLDGEDT